MGRDSDYNSPEYHPEISEAFRRFGEDFTKVAVTAPQDVLAFAQAYSDMIRCVPEEHSCRRDIEESLGRAIHEIVNPTEGRKHGNMLVTEQALTDCLILIEEGGDGPAAGNHWRNAEIIPMAPQQRLSQHFKKVAYASQIEVASDTFLQVVADREAMDIYADTLASDFMGPVPENHKNRQAMSVAVGSGIGIAFSDMKRMARDGASHAALYDRFTAAVDAICRSCDEYTAADDPLVRVLPRHPDQP